MVYNQLAQSTDQFSLLLRDTRSPQLFFSTVPFASSLGRIVIVLNLFQVSRRAQREVVAGFRTSC